MSPAALRPRLRLHARLAHRCSVRPFVCFSGYLRRQLSALGRDYADLRSLSAQLSAELEREGATAAALRSQVAK